MRAGLNTDLKMEVEYARTRKDEEWSAKREQRFQGLASVVGLRTAT